MDSLELIRDSAATMHSKLVARGVDALDPDALVQGAIQDLDLVMTFLPKGDAGLKASALSRTDPCLLRACLRSSEQQAEECQVDHLQAGIELAFAVFP